jgi:hypothetical protein
MNRGMVGMLGMMLLVAGCGQERVPTYPVKGRVVFDDGQPVRSGTVELESMEAPLTASGRIQNDGTFVLGTYTPDDGAAAGKHRAIVVQLIISDGVSKHDLNHGRPVDARFGNFETSGLTAEVEQKESNELTLSIPRLK